MWDSEVMWWEALIMLIFYIGYIVIMKFNKNLKACISSEKEDNDEEEKIPMNQSIVKNQEWIKYNRGQSLSDLSMP